MKKRVISMLLMSMVCLWLAGCGKAPSAADSAAESATGQEQTVKTEQTNGAEQTTDAEMTASQGGTAQAEAAQQEETEKRVAKDGAQMQTEDKSMPTRVPMEGGTRINMFFGDTLITGVLNDSETARALIEKLPVTQHVSRYSHDFCGITEELPYNEEEVHYGWLNGDIDYAVNAPYFTILFEDEDVSEQFGDQVNIGVITTPLSEIAELEGSYDVRIELAQQ
jgi:hypothetical protein